MAGDPALATEDGSRYSLLGDPALAMEETFSAKMLGDPFPTNGGDIDVVNGR